MAFKTQQAMGREQITGLADRRYFNGDQVFSYEGTGVSPVGSGSKVMPHLRE
jgi:hypothetical protein